MTASSTPPARTVARRHGTVVGIDAILGLSLLLSYDFSGRTYGSDTWPNFIAGVQVSTLIGVVGILWLWVRSRGPWAIGASLVRQNPMG